MKIGIRSFFLTILIVGIAIFSPFSRADDAALLPNAVQQFFDNNGNPLSSGYVYTYEVGTTTNKTTWKDSAKAVPNTNPIRLDGGGKAIIWGDGIYRQLVKASNFNVIWDAVTAPGGSGSVTPTLVGDGQLVGSIKPWAGLVAPNQYVFAYGQEISRTTYSDYYTASVQSANVICSNGSNTLTGVADTTQINVGSPAELICVPAGTTVSSKTSTTVVLSAASNISLNTVAVFFPFGNGNGSTTFNVPDLRGVVIAGRPNMGGTALGNLTSTYYGTNPNAQGAKGGNESHTQTVNELVSHTHSPTDPGHTHAQQGNIGATHGTVHDGGGTGFDVIFTPNAFNTLSSPTGITIGNTGGGQAFTITQPTITLNYVIKITPDVSTSTATGVASLGGMTGVIACGTGLLCTGNIVSVTGSTVTSGVVGNLAYYDTTTEVTGNINANMSAGTLTLGIANSIIGRIILEGSTSGAATITPQATAGTPTLTLGTSSGTPAVTASSPLAITTSTGNITCATCVTSSGGGAISGTAPIAVSAAGVVSITGAAGQVLAGASPAFTATPTLGASGTLGSLTFGNATSGLVTLQPVTGALGTVTVSIPAVTDILVTLAAPQALTTKTYNGLNLTSTTGTLTIANNASAVFVTSGNFTQTHTVTATTNSTYPAGTHTLAGLDVAQSWTAVQTFTNSDIKLLGSSSGATTFTSANAGASNFTLTFPAATDTLAAIGTAQTWTAIQTFTNSDIKLLGSSTGATTFTSANAGASNFTLTFPGITSTLVTQGDTNTVANSVLATAAAYTFKGNATGSTASVTDFTVAGLTHKASPVGGDLLMIADSAASNATKYSTLSELIAGAGSGTVTSVVCGATTITTTGTCTGNLLGFQAFVASGTYTRTAGATRALVTCVGGGGGGGGVTSGTDASGAGGGGSGEWVQKLVTTIAADSPITVTAGTGGTAGTTSGTSGSAGGTTTFASSTPVTAIGGGGGTGDTTGQGPRAGGAGGTGGTGVDVAIKGTPGVAGLGINTIIAIGFTLGQGGNGGGQGGGIGTNSSTGVAGTRGGGGSGGSSAGAGSAAGGLGGVGWCTVAEFS